MRIIASLLIFTGLVLNFTNIAAQETGGISGKITDGSTGEPMRSVTVAVIGTKRGAYSDVKGTYTVRKVEPGTYSLRFSFVGFQAKTVEKVVVAAGKVTTLDMTLQPEVKKSDEVVVEARRVNDNSAAILAQRKNSAQVSDGVSQEEISKTPDGDAGQALRRISGVTLVGDKFVYVRGVSDRYNSTTLNGAALATTEPDKRSFAFDMFPAEFLQNANVAKSFTPDLPGNFVGGLVQLNTVDFPDGFGVKASFSSSYNSNVTLQDRRFVTTPGGPTDWLGVSGAERELPASAPADRAETDRLYREAGDFNNPEKQVAAQQRLQQFARDMPARNWKRDSLTANPNTSFSLSYSDIFNVADNDLGLIASFSYGNSYALTEAPDRNTYLDASPERITGGQITNRSAGFGGMANLAYKIGTTTSLSFKNIYNCSIDDNTTILSGADSTQGIDIRQFSSQFVQKTLYSTQVGGEHTLPFGNLFLDWRVGYSASERDEPDFRRLRYTRQSADPSLPFIADIQPKGDGTLAGRFFSNLSDNITSGAVNVTIPQGETKFKVGGAYESRSREFKARSFVIASRDGSGLLGTPFYAGNPDEIFAAQNFDPAGDTLYIAEDSKPSDGYSGTEKLAAAYAMIDAPITLGDLNFRVVGGLRLEDNSMALSGFRSNGTPINVDYKTTDVLPGIGIIYKMTQATNIRLSASQTLTRPTFRELAPFEFYNFNDLIIVKGNPDMKRTLVQNLDLRWEMFTNPGEVMSVSGFYKRFVNPIEETLSGETGGKPERTWVNGGATFDAEGNITHDGLGTNYGIEFELRKSLGFLGEYLGNFMVNANVSFVNSEITISQGNTTETRAMWGQSPYSINLGLYFVEPEWKTSANIAYNRAGRRIVSVAQLGRFPSLADPHWYEEPRDVIDVSLVQPIFSNMEVKFVIKDLLNQKLLWNQGDRLVQSNVFGTTYSLGVSYRWR